MIPNGISHLSENGHFHDTNCPSTVLQNPIEVSKQLSSGPDFYSLVKEAVAVENKDSVTSVYRMQPGVSVFIAW